jgi:hypothetical protein
MIAGMCSNSVISQAACAALRISPNAMFFSHMSLNKSQDSSVGIATGYGLDGPGSIPDIA